RSSRLPSTSSQVTLLRSCHANRQTPCRRRLSPPCATRFSQSSFPANCVFGTRSVWQSRHNETSIERGNLDVKRGRNPERQARIEYMRVENYRALKNVEFKNITPVTALLG